MLHRVSLSQPPNFSFTECLWFLDRSFDDCLHRIDATSVTKLVHINLEPFLLRISETGKLIQIDVLEGSIDKIGARAIERYVSEWLDMERDILPIKHLAAADPEISELVGRYWGLRLISIPELFEALCWSIIGQQINLKFAYKLKRSLVEAAGDSSSYQGEKYYAFPTPAQLLNMSVGDMKQMQFSTQKANYLLIISRAFINEEISKEKLLALADTPKIVDCLTSLKGIGEWTANYVAMKCLRRMDAITYTDAGLLNGFKKLKGLDRKPSRPELESFFSRFPGWEAYMIFYIWRSLS